MQSKATLNNITCVVVYSNILRWQVFNGLFIARYFLKYLVQNSKEIELINQFELQTGK